MTLKNIANYISGFTDGEGCFCVSFSYRPKNIKVGWEVKPSFAVGQNYDRAETLELMKSYFRCGFMRRDYADKTLKFEVRSIDDLLDRVIRHFKKYPLYSAKQKDFILFEKICKKIKKCKHLEPDGIAEIVELAYRMNGSGKRKHPKEHVLARIIR
ncbi:MAG: LAGLIDADG family homing endonuclease [bacterium]|nr:LAGLIDADG family homing endonuclease [bacterium]